MSMTMARLAVERGAREVFDRFFTSERDGVREDWEHYIDLDDLDLWSDRRCVIGQMAPVISDIEDKDDPSYTTALKALGRVLGTNVSDEDEDSEYGPWAKRHGFESSSDFSWSELRIAWVDEIQGRLEKLEKA